jgi:hypothetical protein
LSVFNISRQKILIFAKKYLFSPKNIYFRQEIFTFAKKYLFGNRHNAIIAPCNHTAVSSAVQGWLLCLRVVTKRLQHGMVKNSMRPTGALCNKPLWGCRNAYLWRPGSPSTCSMAAHRRALLANITQYYLLVSAVNWECAKSARMHAMHVEHASTHSLQHMHIRYGHAILV